MYGDHNSYYPLYHNVSFNHQNIPNYEIYCGQETIFQAYPGPFDFPEYPQPYQEQPFFFNHEEFYVKAEPTSDFIPKL